MSFFDSIFGRNTEKVLDGLQEPTWAQSMQRGHDIQAQCMLIDKLIAKCERLEKENKERAKVMEDVLDVLDELCGPICRLTLYTMHEQLTEIARTLRTYVFKSYDYIIPKGGYCTAFMTLEDDSEPFCCGDLFCRDDIFTCNIHKKCLMRTERGILKCDECSNKKG